MFIFCISYKFKNLSNLHFLSAIMGDLQAYIHRGFYSPQIFPYPKYSAIVSIFVFKIRILIYFCEKVKSEQNKQEMPSLKYLLEI